MPQLRRLHGDAEAVASRTASDVLYSTVYNLHVEDFHTFFVGDSVEWGWSVWAHNIPCSPNDVQDALANATLKKTNGATAKELSNLANDPTVNRLDLINRLGKLRPSATPHQLAQVADELFAKAGRTVTPVTLGKTDLADLRKQLKAGNVTPLDPDTIYVTDAGSPQQTHYTTDSQGRVERIRYVLDSAGVKAAGAPRKANSNHTTPLGAPLSKVAGDVGYHGRPDQGLGLETYPNVQPYSGRINNSQAKSLEGMMVKAARAGKSIEVEMRYVYDLDPAKNPGVKTDIRASSVEYEITRSGGSKYSIAFDDTSAKLTTAQKTVIKNFLGI